MATNTEKANIEILNAPITANSMCEIENNIVIVGTIRIVYVIDVINEKIIQQYESGENIEYDCFFKLNDDIILCGAFWTISVYNMKNNTTEK